jgi:hypothetical protein
MLFLYETKDGSNIFTAANLQSICKVRADEGGRAIASRLCGGSR